MRGLVTKKMLGMRIRDEFQEETMHLEKPKIPLSEYLKKAKKNLMSTSRTAHGIIDTSASPSKIEAIGIDA